MQATEESVTIGLREIYEQTVRTHEAVILYAPRLDAVEKLAAEAVNKATEADTRSKENRLYINGIRRAISVLGTLVGGLILAYAGAWFSKHIL